MPKKKKVNYGKGCRGCFLTLIQWPVLLIGLLIISFAVFVVLQTLLPTGQPLIHAVAAVIIGVTLVRIFTFVVNTFLGYARQDDDEGIVG